MLFKVLVMQKFLNIYLLKLVVSIALVLSPCSSMSSTEAAFRCQSSIEKAQKNYEKLNNVDNADLKKIASTVLSLMNKILEEILHESISKDFPAKTQLCIKHAEHIAWLQDIISPAMQLTKLETKRSSLESKSQTKSLPKKQTTEEKTIKLDQQKFDSKDLEKTLNKQNISKLDDKKNSTVPIVLAPSL